MRAIELHAPVKQIQRSKGRSSVGAAAYRSASRLIDERTGITHDYTKKQGVEHCRIYAPDDAPAWATDRAKLWNAAEAKENRSNSCTARELELAFPAEFHAMQRREAGDAICRELVRRYGCAVDIAYHQPNSLGDERNFHAHILFTTRGFDEASKDGWSRTKYRDLNNDQITIDDETTTRGKQEILSLREFTAKELNRIAERDKLQVRTEHLSFEARGIDREPTQHRGQSATDMERRGHASRIENENRQRQQRNGDRATVHAQAAQQVVAIMDRQKPLAEQAALRQKVELESQRHYAEIELGQKHQREKLALGKTLEETYSRKTIEKEIGTVQDRLQATGFKKVVRDVFRKTATDQQHLGNLEKTLANVKMRESEMREALESNQRREREKMQQQERQKIEQLERQRQQGQQGRDGDRGQQPRRRKANEDMLNRQERRDTDRPQSDIAQEWARKSAKVEPDKGRTIDNRDLKPVAQVERKKTDQPTPQPPPPRQAMQIAQNWAEKSGQAVTVIKDQAVAPTRDQSQQRPSQPDKTAKPSDIAQSWQERSAQRQAERSNDNPPERTLTPKPTRELKPKR